MNKTKLFKKSTPKHNKAMKASDPLELLKNKRYPDEKEYQRKAFLMYMAQRDRELDENECLEKTATLCRVAVSTIKGWKREFGWDDRYSEHVSNIMLLVAASYQPELRKQGHAIMASLTATRIDIELRTEKYFIELEEYQVAKKEYMALPDGDKKKKKMPELPIPPFGAEGLAGLVKYTEVLKMFTGDDKGIEGPDMSKFTEDELRKIMKKDTVKIENVENLQINQSQEQADSPPDDHPIDV